MQENSLFAQAVNSARTIVRFDAAIFAFAVLTAIEWWLSILLPDLGNFASVLRTILLLIDLIWFLPLAAIINWFISYGGYETNDAEFLTMRKSLMMSFALWLAANAFNLLLLNYEGWFNY